MPPLTDPARARERIEGQIRAIGRLRGSGPNPFDYDQWEARTLEVLDAIYGAESPELSLYRAAVETRGRLVGVRGQAGDMTLNIHGPWGIQARLDRAEAVLTELLGEAPPN